MSWLRKSLQDYKLTISNRLVKISKHFVDGLWFLKRLFS